MRSRGFSAAAILALASYSATSAIAQTAYFSTQGDFTANSATQDFFFDLTRSVTSSETLRFETFSSRGTTLNAAGDTSPTIGHGFDSILTLTNEAGTTTFGSNDDGAAGTSLDSLLSWNGIADSAGNLGAGPLAAANNYRLRLNEFDNLTGPWGIDFVGPANALKLRDFRPGNTPATPSTVRSLKFGTNGVAAVGSAEAHAIFSPTVLTNGNYVVTGDMVVAQTGNASFIMDDFGDAFTVGGNTTVKLGGDMQIMFSSVFNAIHNVVVDGGRVNLTGTARMNLGDVSGLSDLYVNNGGRVDVNAGTTLGGVDATIRLGDSGNATENQLVVTNGTVTSRSGIIGFQSGSNNRATLTGASTTWTLGSDLYVGRVGNGTLEITNGAKVTNRDGLAGYSVGGVGTITLSGSGSTWTNTRDLYLGDVTNSGVGNLTINAGARLNVGDTAASNNVGTFSFVEAQGSAPGPGGVLAVYNGSTLTNTANSGLSIGRGVGRRGSVIVSGTGSTITDNETFLGFSGTGTLTVNAGGKYTANNAFFATSGGTATVSVDGAGSQLWSKGNLDLGSTAFGGSGTITTTNGGTILVGDAAFPFAGTDLVVTDASPIGTAGGVLSVSNGSTLTTNQQGEIGFFSGEAGRVIVTGTGSLWTGATIVFLGNNNDQGSRGELVVENGGRVSGGFVASDGTGSLFSVSSAGRIESTTQFVISQSGGSNTTATVSGTNSTLAVGSQLEVGRAGTGTLNIQSAGKVTAVDSILGKSTDSSGTVNVTDAGSLFNTSHNLSLGQSANSGVGHLTISPGARINVGDTAAAIPPDDYSYIDDSSANASDGGTLFVNNGSTITNNSTGLSVGEVSGHSGRVVVSGPGSIVNTGFAAVLGNAGNGRLEISAGGAWKTDSIIEVGFSAGGNGVVTVDGAGSVLWSKGDVRLGLAGHGDIGLTNGGELRIGDSATGNGPNSLEITDIDPIASNAGGLLTIGAGSTVTALGTNVMGRTAGQSGRLVITGNGSTLTGGIVFIGDRGKGDARVEAGGDLIGSQIVIGAEDTSDGTLAVTGVGSTATAPFIDVGVGKTGVLSIAAGGAVSVANIVTLGSRSTGVGTINLSGTGSTLNVTGTLTVGGSGAGTVNLSGGTLKAATITRGASSTFSFTGGKLVAHTFTGQLTQAGGINSPGNVGVRDLMSISGGYTINSGSLEVDLFATNNDAITSGGPVNLAGGSLALNNVSFPTTLGTTRILIDAPSRTGVFASVSGLQLSTTRFIAVTYNPNGVQLKIARPGDADINGTVNFDDLLILAQNYSDVTPNRIWALGDFDGDGKTKFEDLLLLAQNYNLSGLNDWANLGGQFSSDFAADWARAVSIAVPEPTTLMSMAAMALSIRRRRNA